MTDAQKILIVDDTPANIQILNDILRTDHRIFFAMSGPEGIEIARKELPDLILLDIMMPGMDGYAVCSVLKSEETTRNIPIIFITAMASPEDEAKGLEAGAVDYIMKPVSPPILRARVRNHLELKKISDELAEKNRQLERMALEDALTKIANRRHFNQALDAEIRRGNRTGEMLTLILADLDFFKRYNDHLGHLAGDHCLEVVGEVLRRSFRRAGDLAARYGGEEFAVILPDTPPETALTLAENLRREMEEEGLPHPESEAGAAVTLSVGVVTAPVTAERSAEWFTARADQALYRSKETGRNRVTALVYP